MTFLHKHFRKSALPTIKKYKRLQTHPKRVFVALNVFVILHKILNFLNFFFFLVFLNTCPSVRAYVFLLIKTRIIIAGTRSQRVRPVFSEIRCSTYHSVCRGAIHDIIVKSYGGGGRKGEYDA